MHAVFTLPRWTAAAWLLFAGLALMLVADAVYARLVADGTYTDGGILDALWPIAYLLLAAAVMHPSMRALWESRDVELVRDGRARMVVLGTALFAVPGVVLLDDSGSSTAIILAVDHRRRRGRGRLAHHADRRRVEQRAASCSRESEARFRALVQHATDIVIVLSDTRRGHVRQPRGRHRVRQAGRRR